MNRLFFILILFFSALFTTIAFAQTPGSSLALRPDGKDNNVRIGMRIVKVLWTLEEWVKGDDPSWKNREVIIDGDFNSYSHLDWTKAAAPLHCGYGPVAFSTSRYLLNEGYKDSSLEMNPNGVERPEGTWAVIYGQLQNCRIDFLYYKGNNIKTVSSKIVKTAPEIDDAWASDHVAVLTTFELTK